ncbi:sensor histidine kinase [Sporolactobacillus terrae]|uniref:histidine kinase n=1 Tax=Sporolactobacillus terrae TaxID=269673 RepID=A0ABX5Q865_9BACL|nr:HAMP domain-containing sensor histidine kinase [Sporolactobacillus terrae]QAA22811.1 two-component sensor histidine kinase [Sporolactobacillus terrae]QAA25784.1 two-component sensor histidine kinase [Sporolactobacillus terrae]UAK17663.1 HAMP domain-containing histidine kinase [Sporolactobacillus terrae]
MITIIYRESFLTVTEKEQFEEQLSLEFRFCIDLSGHILECNKKGQAFVERFGHDFLKFFSDLYVDEAQNFLNAIKESDDIVTALLHDQLNELGLGTLYNGFTKNGKIILVGFHTQILARLTGEFVHELRNPLTIIKGFLQLSNYTKEYEKYHPVILSEIERMHTILDNFLTMSLRKCTYKKMNPNELCKQLVALLSAECTVNHVAFDYDIAYTENHCNVDLDKVKQVVINLLRNAMEAFEIKNNENKIILRGSVEDRGYRFSLIDNGPGMDREVLKRLGQPLYTTKSKGTGIGISLCKKIIAEHRGTFCVSSVPRKGTTVSFYLPFVSPAV